MTESREVLIEATANADREALKTTGASPYDEILDAILAHPVAVLDLLENAPCPTCGGTGERRIAERPESQGLYIYQCHTCSGSGVIGREGVLALLGWDLDALAGHLDACLDSLGHTDVSSREWLAEFAAPQPCGTAPGETDTPAVPSSPKGDAE